MTLLDGSGSGGSGEVTTLSSRYVHRNGSSNNKKHLGSFNSDINANTTNNLSNGVQRVPEIQTKTEDGGHDLKKWSEVCKMSSPPTNGFPNKRPESSMGTSNSSTNGDSNNNDSSDSSVMPDMDFSN